MKHLSYWASAHKWLARLLIAGCLFSINILGILLSLILFEKSTVHLAPLIVLVAAIIAATAAMRYEQTRRTGGNYRRERICHLMLCLSTFLLVTGNTASIIPQDTPCNAARRIMTENTIRCATCAAASSISGKVSRWAESLKAHYREISTGRKIAIIFGYVFLAFILAGIWAAVCCSISCSGAEALAIVLFFAGLAGIVFGATLLIQKSFGTGRWKRSKKAGGDAPNP